VYELVTFCVTVSVIIGATTIGAVAGVLVYISLHKFDKPTGHGSALHPHPGDPKRRVSH